MAKRQGRLSIEQLKELARSGAESLLKQLRAQIVAIERTFPELASGSGRRALRQAVKKAGKRRRKMSAAARKEVSKRMKKYWAARRKAAA